MSLNTQLNFHNTSGLCNNQWTQSILLIILKARQRQIAAKQKWITKEEYPIPFAL
jgi:hypothetical protein